MKAIHIIKYTATFVAGVAAALAGVKIWFEQPDQILVRQAYLGQLERPRPVNGMSVAPIWSMDDLDTPKGWPDEEPALSLVPLTPAISWTPDKVAAVCAYIDTIDNGLVIDITPTEAAAHETRDRFGALLDAGGMGPRYAVMFDPDTIMFNFETNGPRLHKFDEATASSTSSAADFTRLSFNINPAYHLLGLWYLSGMAQSHPISDCDPEDTAGREALDARLEKYLGLETVHAFRRGPKPQ